MVSAPRFTISLTRVAAFLPGHPPQELIPASSISAVSPSKAPRFSFMNFKSVEAGHMSSVCMQRISPIFIMEPSRNFSMDAYMIKQFRI
ncbi:hypothetical protein SDC9_162345 [bioreactor metagenome]|uniref:Uncharacterized protein n=1 Tax=bioreactor metagenome TaxID=1076179 RepID=A0A645FMW6_9ZZZZ